MKNYKNDYELIKEWVLSKKNIPYIKGFYAEAIKKDLNIPLEKINEICLELAKENILKIKYELKCLNCLSTLESSTNKENLKNVKKCMYCEEETWIEKDIFLCSEIMR